MRLLWHYARKSLKAIGGNSSIAGYSGAQCAGGSSCVPNWSVDSRYAVASNNGVLVSLPDLQTDDTWTLLLNAHIYFASVLQDISVEGQRTDSNGYGFSNWVESVSWAGVIRPSSSFYLQLFFRLYFKQYDLDPLKLPDLQLGFIDEDSQDLLSAKANWEFAPQWVGSLSLSRIRSESDQPGAYYIKNMASFQIRRSF